MTLARGAVFVLLLCTLVPRPAAAQDDAERGLGWRNGRPSMTFGEDVYVGVRSRLVLDWRGFAPGLDEDRFDLNVMRLGLKGALTRHASFEVEREIDRDGGWEDWKDVYLDWTTFRGFSVRGGRYKVPFGFEQNLGRTDLDFAYRARISTQLTPARDRGVMAHGQAAGRALEYQVGVFNSDGDIGKLEEPQFPTNDAARLGPTAAVRLTGTVLRPFVAAASPLRSLRLGAAYTTGRVPEGLNSLRGETPYGFDFFGPVYVKGRRQRLGVELDWTPGPFGVRAEWIETREDRRGQGLGNTDLSDVVGSGWYLSGTWIVTGQDKDDSISMRRSLLRGGPGAIELALRYEELGFASAAREGAAERNPRAGHLLENRTGLWTAGVNWHLVPGVRVVFNGLREHFSDPARTPQPGETVFWSAVTRLQIAF